jgi:aspartate carbamoyltransferase catalytic subunit
MNAAFFPSAREYSRRYGLDDRRMASLPDHAIVMHPGPMNRGMEISATVADSPRSVIVEQVTNGVAVRMAVLYLLLSGEREARGSHAGRSSQDEAIPQTSAEVDR